MGSCMSDFLRVKANGAKVDVNTEVKDLITINITEAKGDATKGDTAKNDIPKSNTEIIDIIKIIQGDTFLSTIYVDKKERSFVRLDKAQGVITKYIDMSGNYYIQI